MKKKLFFVFGAAVLLAACVPQRKYMDLETKFKDVEQRQKACDEELKATKEEKEKAKEDLSVLMDKVAKLRTDSMEMHTLFESNRKVYTELKDSYEKLLKNNELTEGKMMISLKEMEDKLMQKEKDLSSKEANLSENQRKNEQLRAELEKIQSDLSVQQKKVNELQSVLTAKDSAVKSLRNTLNNALLGFKDKGLTVEVRNGKVYVSMDEKLLFASGSIVVDAKGKEALIQLAKSIQNMEDINIMVEGHTDDVPISTPQIKDNWDLSVLRATSIVRLLTKEGKVDAKRFIASGRGEFFPVDPAKSPEARAKNRRTEIIISPKLDEVFKILDSN